jgi:hypothetical protein
MANGGHISNELSMTVANGAVIVDIFPNITGGNRSSLNNFDDFGNF